MRSTSAGRRRRPVDNAAYIAMVRRMIISAGQRVSEGDTDDLVALLALKDVVDTATAEAVAGLRGSGFTWQDIGDALGTTRQAAIMRWVVRA